MSTEASFADDQRKWLESILNRMPIAFFLIDPRTGKVTFANDYSRALAGRQVVGTLPDERYRDDVRVYDSSGRLLCKDEIPSVRAARGEIMSQEHFSLETPSGRLDVIVATDMIPASYGHQETAMLLVQDVTATKAAERALEKSEADFRLLAEAIPQMLFVADATGNITYFNQRWYQYVGLSSGQTEGWAWQDQTIHHPDDLQRTLETWNESLRTGQPYQIEYRLRRADGAYRWHLGRAIPVRDQAGQIVKWLGTNTDIHDQRTLAEQLEMAVSVARLGFWDYRFGDPKVQWSEQLRQHFGFPEGMYEGTLDAVFAKILPDDRQMVTRALADAQAKHSRLHLQFRVTPEPEVLRWVECQGECYFDVAGKAVRMNGTSRDVTEERIAAEQLKAAKETAESANKLKSAFLANMSHEIRTPLGAILGFSDLLKDRNLSPDEREQFVATIERAGKALTRLIDDILDLSKVEAGRLETESVEFSLHELLDEVLDLFKEKAKAKGIYLELDVGERVPELICSDPTRVRQILLNLVGNALKFTAHGGVTISVRAEPNANAEVQLKIRVKDTGIGLTDEQKSKLFQPFMQADNSTTRRFGGTGLGLALSKRLADALSGDIQLEHSCAGEGCTFAFTFTAMMPRSKSQPKPQYGGSLPENESKMPLSGVRVLLAEDAPDNQFLISRLLTKSGAKVDVANNGAEAVAKAQINDYDLVFMDIQMPVLDGYEATKALRRLGYRRPIIALTAHAMVEEQRRTKEAGCDEHLTKPVDFVKLLETVQRYFRK